MEKVIDRPVLEYNLAGGLLRTLDRKSFEGLLEGLSGAGYEAACVLPFRALTKSLEPLEKSPLKVVHLEEAWNPTNEDNLVKSILAGLIGHYKRLRGDTNEPPILQDSLFPGKATCERLFQDLFGAFPNVKFISHKVELGFPQNRVLVEINPGVKMSLEQLLSSAEENGFGLVFDPKHLLSSDRLVSFPGEPTKRHKGDWEKQFTMASRSGKLEVIDINPPSKTDLNDLFKGVGMLKELAMAASENGIRFIRVEVPMPISTQIPGSPLSSKGFEFLREIGSILRT